MQSVDVPVALLGYGTVGAAVHRLLAEQGDEIERATGHRLRVVRALVRDPSRGRGFDPGAGVLTTDVSNQSGRSLGTRFWKKLEPPTPLGNRCISTGRPWIAAMSGCSMRR